MNESIIRLMIIDDNCDNCELLNDYFNRLPDVKVVGTAYNGQEGYELFKELKPDIVLLDVIMPIMDGFGFLDQAKQDNLLELHRVIMISEISQESIVRHAFHLGAHYYILKPLDLVFLTNRIRYIAKEIQQAQTKSSPREILRPMDVQSKIAKILIDSGLPVHTLGYKYFDCALNYLINDNCEIFSITKSVYPYVASKFDTSSSCVDKAMRHSLSLAFTQNNKMLTLFLKDMNYHNLAIKPSNSEYLNLILAKVKKSSMDKVWS